MDMDLNMYYEVECLTCYAILKMLFSENQDEMTAERHKDYTVQVRNLYY